MAQFQSVEARDYPTLGLTLQAGTVVDLPDDTDVAGLVLQTSTNASKKAAPVAPVVADPAPVTEGVADGAPTV
jgi:hypothetical protein